MNSTDGTATASACANKRPGRLTGVRTMLAGGVFSIVLDAPERLNALSVTTINQVARAVEDTSRDPSVRVIVLTGEGRAFCSGADLAADATDFADPVVIDGANRLTSAITTMRTPVVCGLNGVAAGVGVSIALACDLIVAREGASLVLGFSKIGLIPDGGATALIAASLGRSRALALALLGEPLAMQEAVAAGLVLAVYEDGEFPRALEELAARIASGPTRALGETKRAINASALGSLPRAFQHEREVQLQLLSGPEFAEGTTAFRERRTPNFHAVND
jgi:enoyl-CoA hydratase